MAGQQFVRARIDGPLFDRLAKAGGTRYAVGWSGAVQRALFQASVKAQELAVTYLDESITRQLTKTGRLHDAVAASENRYSSSVGFGVGLVEYLDQEARYWRMIEEGTAKAAPGYAREVYGWFRSPGLPFAEPGRTSPPDQLIGPSGYRSWDRLLEMGDPDNPNPLRRPHLIEIHDFPAHEFYKRAWQEMFHGGWLRDFLADELSEIPAPLTGERMDWRRILDEAGIH
jgi:hypothetical protein